MKKHTAFGKKLLGRLEKFADALAHDAPLDERLTVRRVSLDLKTAAYDGRAVKRTRKLLGLSQALFAGFLGASVKTVQSWEQGKSEPQEMACRFMDEIQHDPEYWKRRLAAMTKTKVLGNRASGRKARLAKPNSDQAVTANTADS